jgi:hypothetical protein
MTKLYKLTDAKHCTYNNTQWGENVTHETDGAGGLCGPGWLHAYEHPLLAVFLNPIHVGFSDPVLWEAKGNVERNDNGLKCGTRKLTTLRIIPLPEVTPVNRVAFAILCAKEVCKDANWNAWADEWLSGEDRSESAADAAEDAAEEAASRAAAAAAEAAAAAASAAAEAAAWAAESNGSLDLVALAEKAMLVS